MALCTVHCLRSSCTGTGAGCQEKLAQAQGAKVALASSEDRGANWPARHWECQPVPSANTESRGQPAQPAATAATWLALAALGSATAGCQGPALLPGRGCCHWCHSAAAATGATALLMPLVVLGTGHWDWGTGTVALALLTGPGRPGVAAAPQCRYRSSI
jgi:hypothetical protein